MTSGLHELAARRPLLPIARLPSHILRSIAVYRLTGETNVVAAMLFPNVEEWRESADRHPKVEGARKVTIQVVMSPYKGLVWSGA